MSSTQDSLPIKELLAAAAPIIKSIVDTFVTPKLEQLKKKFAIDYKKHYVPTQEHFAEYFFRIYKKVSVVNTLVFNNQQRFLKDIYIPLTITKNSERSEKYQITGYPDKLLVEYEKVLITDTAGMGKSTMIKRIFLDIIDNKVGIPILVELRRLTKEKSLLKELYEQIDSLETNSDPQLLNELISEGGFIFILDGYDEISLLDRETVTTDIQTFISKAPSNKYVLTSRPENALNSFGDFQKFTIEPLLRNEAFQLLSNYDNDGQISSLLIKKLEESDMSNISEFLTNPLLVSLLFTAFSHKQAIPFKKYLFYRQVYDANFESHDLTKGDSYIHDKYCKLEIDDFHRILRHIGFASFKYQKIEFEKDEILKLIRESKKFCVGIDLKESDFLKDILTTVPLFTQDGIYFRWAHKSLQEYFAAQFIYLDTKEQQARVLKRIYEHANLEKFLNILDLYYDMDYKTFRNVILFDLLTIYSEHYKTYLANHKIGINKEDLVLRKELTFLTQPYLFYVDAERLSPDKVSLRVNAQINSLLSPVLFNGFIVNNTSNVRCVYLSDFKELILSLLYQKKSILVVTAEFVTHPLKEIKHDLKEEYELHELSDDPENIFNLPDNFSQINALLIYSKMDDPIIVTDKALKMLNEIEKTLKDEHSEDFLLEGI